MLYEVITIYMGYYCYILDFLHVFPLYNKFFYSTNFRLFKSFYHRITSYNVCYTKLLRSASLSELEFTIFKNQ